MAALPPLHVGGRGAGDPTLVFLHYFAGSSLGWSAVITELAPDHRCVAPDLRGFGASAFAPNGGAMADAADDVALLVARLGLERYVLVGHSMGAKVALALAARRPAGLNALILVAPSPPTPEPIADADRARLLASHGDRAAAEENAGKITHRARGTPEFDLVVADNLRTSLPAWRAWLKRGSREDLADLAPRIDVPVLVVAGRDDETIPLGLVEREVVARFSGARLVQVAGARHLVPLDAPEALADAIRLLLVDRAPSREAGPVPPTRP